MPQAFADEFKSFPISAQLGESLERAYRFAREQSHRFVTLEHLLLALTEDVEAAAMLESAGVDLGRLSADVSGYLGGLLEDMRAQSESELRPDADLMRVLKAATTAAQQSRRRQIDGAIVLAAIVGDGKSAAAGLLKALGMTFEGAIRALQRANTQARAKPSPQGAMPAWAPGSGAGRPAAPATAEQRAMASETAAAPINAEISLATSAEEFLAAARARIQQRAAAARAGERPAAAVAAPSPAVATGGEKPNSPMSSTASSRGDLNPSSLAAAIRDVASEPGAEAQPAPVARTAEPPPEPIRDAAAPQPGPPAPEPGVPVEATASAPPPPRNLAVGAEQPAVARLPQPAPNRGPGPLPGRPMRPADGAGRPPLPQGPKAPNRFPPGLGPPPRGGRAPRGPNGAGASAPSPGRPVGAPMQPAMADAGGAIVVPLQPRTGSAAPASYAERGPLAESVPRRMRSGVPATAEVRIARDKIDGLMLALCNRSVRPEAYPTRALAVRLRAPNGGFAIEANAPETQWIDRSTSAPGDSFAGWRWTITPHSHGRNRLLLTVSARLIGPDGLVAEAAPSDRSIDVKIAPNYGRLGQRWAGWLAALLAGIAFGQFAGDVWAGLLFLLRQAGGG
ncbi:MAG TPA: Clp protease N-terminal domain-containing protein [Hyphomicrobiaceae bacterium]|nr:Clp protease N-terminal domain-containing protein [Hyphomicrobiaceae bacterium]